MTITSITSITPRTRDPLSLVIRRYLADLEREGVPLTAPVTVAAVLDDLCALAEIPAPASVVRALDPDEAA